MTGPHEFEVVGSVERFSGRIITLRTDTVRMPGGDSGDRDVVRHPGAVGVVALDDDGRVLLVKQYRHPVGARLWELPAGIKDVDGESPVDTARRELLEETGWTASRWQHLVTIHSSPGFTDESYEVFLARGLSEADERPDVKDEELDLEPRWVPLVDACAEVLDGRITNGMCAVGVLAAARTLDVS